MCSGIPKLLVINRVPTNTTAAVHAKKIGYVDIPTRSSNWPATQGKVIELSPAVPTIRAVILPESEVRLPMKPNINGNCGAAATP